MKGLTIKKRPIKSPHSRGEGIKPKIIRMEANEPLVPEVVLGGKHQMEQTKEQHKGRLLRLTFNSQQKFPHVNPRSQIEVTRETFKFFRTDTSK